MEKYGVNELRKMFLDFFESKGHLARKSFYRSGDPAEDSCVYLPEVYPYRRYRKYR